MEYSRFLKLALNSVPGAACCHQRSLGHAAGSAAPRDSRLLTMIAGVGKKTAERIVVDLRDKFAAEDTIAALVSLGFPQPQARKSVQAALEDVGRDAPVEEIRIHGRGSERALIGSVTR
jgi:Holliday junction resolvasome RuvABC DNA-binding subunit